MPYTKDTLEPPIISDLRYYEGEFNGYPQIAVTLTVPDDLKKNQTVLASKGGGINVEWEARVPGGEWVGLQGDGDITAGEHVIALQNLAENIKYKNTEAGISNPDIIIEKDSPIELRARYFCNQYESYGGEWLGEFYTDYSEVLTFGAQEMSKNEEPSPAESSIADESKAQSSVEASKDESKEQTSKDESKEQTSIEASKSEEKKGGFPIWIIILIIIIVLIIIIIIIILVLKKKKDDDKNNKTPTGANRQ